MDWSVTHTLYLLDSWYFGWKMQLSTKMLIERDFLSFKPVLQFSPGSWPNIHPLSLFTKLKVTCRRFGDGAESELEGQRPLGLGQQGRALDKGMPIIFDFFRLFVHSLVNCITESSVNPFVCHACPVLLIMLNIEAWYTYSMYIKLTYCADSTAATTTPI